MVDTIALTNAFVTTFQRIPELVAGLGGDPNTIGAYIDLNPTRNSFSAAIYQMKPGTILVIWQETAIVEGEMAQWVHRVQIYIKAQRDRSAQELIRLLINGVPVPGDGQCWRNCAVMDGVYVTNVVEAARVTDDEGIDYFVVSTETFETGDKL